MSFEWRWKSWCSYMFYQLKKMLGGNSVNLKDIK